MKKICVEGFTHIIQSIIYISLVMRLTNTKEDPEYMRGKHQPNMVNERDNPQPVGPESYML